MTTRCAVLGSPVGHSLSPVLHREAYAVLGLDWDYGAVEVTEEGLPGFLAGLDASWRGLSLTMPLKRTVVPLLDELVGAAVTARAANTVVLAAGRRTGHNTDVPGLVAALAEHGVGRGDVGRALVLGGGATAASAALALSDLGVEEVVVAVRDRSRARETVEAVARHPHPALLTLADLPGPDRPGALHPPGAAGWDIVVSTVPAAAQTPGLTDLVAATPAVFEVLYEPWPTPLAAAASAAGRVVVGGLDLLLHQAVLQVELMTGTPDLGDAVLAPMRAAGEAALSARAARATGAS